MPPRSEDIPVSTLKIKPPPNRSTTQNGALWLKDKHETDGAEGLWRVHDDLYDLSSFVKSHPGGSEWLELTKGTDITEAFEVHHLTTAPEETLKKYFVKKAKVKRNSPFTFKDDGFYRTLKREVMGIVKTLPKQVINTSAFFTDLLLVGTFLFAILANTYWNYWLGILAGFFLGCVTIASHNYFHKKDNFRMYYFNLSLMQTREWRISHVLSHHLHTNTIDDMEITMNEPILPFLPVDKSPFFKYGYWVLFSIYWVTAFHLNYLKRVIYIVKGDTDLILWYDFVPYTLPLAMYLVGGQSLLASLWMWTFIVFVASFHFSAVGLNAAHHHPDIFHDGDAPRSDTDYDWGLSQLDAVMERHDITGSHFLVLTNFGDHCLHHLFPTLDHGTLDLLYPALKKGTDITEAFETHHLTSTPGTLLKKFFKKPAKTSRNSPFTFHEDGFYKTLKRNITNVMPNVPKAPADRSKRIADYLVAVYIILAILSAYNRSFTVGMLSGIFLSLTAIAAHNFFHQKDNFRMYYFNFTLMDYNLEPFLEYLPGHKQILVQYVKMIISPVVYPFIFLGSFVRCNIEVILKEQEFRMILYLPFTVLLLMMVASGGDIIFSAIMFFSIQLIGSLHFGAVGLNAAHHHPDIFHDGDTPRPKHEMDWGIYELDAVMDRKDITGSHFLVLTNFGDHALHHLFPTIDHGLLEYLYPTFLKTCADFGIEWKLSSQIELVKGQFMQIAKVKPKEEPPRTLKKIKYL
ncbi:Cyt-b5 and/or FA desaturase domain containing protein [Asbolus verrucosus]|uniref:Cytochrome b5-related protein n=1 Tax=Asbolus verrucosus TaxID=1661398 RepID=A0A482VC93_ASBVE|nr:Cyt-b5 and/or FA desaturase domain containing protein [Asbolus verrucosus]